VEKLSYQLCEARVKTIVAPKVSQERILLNASYNAPILGEKNIPMRPYHNIFSFYWFE
jgi:hypothetical protein